MIKRILFILCILSTSLMAYGQDINQAIEVGSQLYNEKKYKDAIPVLQDAIANYKGEVQSELVLAEILLAKNYMHSWQSDAAARHFGKAYRLGRKINNDSLAIQAGTSLVVLMGFQERQDSVKIIVKELIQYEELKFSDRSNLYNQLAGFYEDAEMIDSAIFYQLKSAKIDSLHQDSSSIPFTFYDLGNYYTAKFQYKEGIASILYGLDYIRGEQDLFKKNTIELGLGNIYLKIRNIEKAEELARKVYESAKENKQQVNLTNSLNALGNCASFRQDYKKAIRYYEMSDSVNNASTKSLWRSLRAKISILEQRLNLNETINVKDIQFLNSIDKKSTVKYLNNRIDLLKLRLGDDTIPVFNEKYDSLYALYKVGNNLALELRFLDVKKDHYQKKGAFRQALLVDNIIDSLNRKIDIENNEYIIQDLEAKYERKVQDERINNLDQQNIIKSKLLSQKNKTIWTGGLALVLISLLSFFLFRLYLRVKSQKELISKALTEKEILLREIHHRVKNNLQLVSSLLTLQGRSIDDATAQQAITEGKTRVRSMALIHHDLYNKENLTDIGVKDYLEKLSKELFDTYNVDHDRIQLELHIEDIDLDVDTVVPIGLILNELITNSLKYAWPKNQNGLLAIHFTKEGDTLTLSVVDDGVGYENVEENTNSFGCTLINALIEQLDGELSVNHGQGTETIIKLPHT